jgi:hypothetical protein
MKITSQQFEDYLRDTPPVIWAWIYTELKDGEAKAAFKATLFDETGSARDLTQPWIRSEVVYLIAKHSEIRMATEKCAFNYYLRNSWEKWLPWNWKHW